jgi:hypothetical protein
MSTAKPVGNIETAMSQRRFPTVTTWNRLEGRPRTRSFDRALKAEVRDALWMLTKQWQMGEFRGSDAGSPVFAKLHLSTTRLTKYRPDAKAARAFGYDVPFEATVEQRPVPLTAHTRPISLDVRLAMGRQWLKLIRAMPGYRTPFIDAYPIATPDPTKRSDADVCAHPEVWQVVAAVAGRAMDGGLLYTYLTADPTHHAYDGVAGVSVADHAAIDTAARRFLEWWARLFLQPTAEDDAWVPTRLEYQFAASAPVPAPPPAPGAPGAEKVYTADEYYQGRLDWYSMDVDAGTAALDPVPGAEVTGLPPDGPRTMIPVPVSFAGMPNTRWWSFEDSKTNYGDIDAATTDLAKLLFLEFALVYANDWFVIPYTLPAGAIAAIRGFVVTNTFGERLWIQAAGSGPDDAWQRWSMFTVNIRNSVHGGASADTSLVLMPTVSKIQEGPPIEDVWLIRDEVANMVWGVERTVPLATGEAKPGAEAAAQTLAFYRAELAARLGGPPPPPPPAQADVRYEVMTTVPEHWIPFLPVHVEGDNREIQLQRAALPRILDGDPDPAVKVEPRTGLLRHGLDDMPAQPYFLHEEEVSRAGTRLLRSYQRTRWTDGRVYTWLRVRRQTGRGEGASGLAFDVLVHSRR